MESYKHLFAKQTLARWLADPDQRYLIFDGATGGGPYGGGVFVEHPFCLDIEGKLHGLEPWHETGLNGTTSFENDVPTYQQCLDAKLLPICIFDVAVRYRGIIRFAFEIVHKHDLTDEKRAYIKRILQESYLAFVYGLDADWVLSQVRPPKKIKTIWQLDCRG